MRLGGGGGGGGGIKTIILSDLKSIIEALEPGSPGGVWSQHALPDGHSGFHWHATPAG